ncbi:MAG: heme lyase CcmF/NrfE family subunit [Betaproteobacteria bacterium]|nr:heme lyase CcmF/NrfE family subunit [Betaproteobacteria bacterium]
MIPEIGQFALILALLLALAQGVLPIVGAARANAAWVSVARPAAQGQFVFVAIAFGCLAWSFANNDFSVLNVATNSNSQLPLQYRIAATWGSHEGSLLLWVLMLGAWTVAVTVFSRHLPEEMVARVLGVMGLVSVGFLLFMLLTSNPFERLLPAAADGRDLNPLLQDPGMVIHPPMLYMGYVGFSVAFAFAIAALLGGRLDATWARWSRPWTTLAWCFLTLGIMLGSWWAYYELGWGGWWFWDPVENASFIPWLFGTALIHSLAVTEKRGGFKSWTVLLAICAFSMSLLGTFLVRSGVLTSVHAFATDPKRGIFILAFLTVVIGGSLALFAWRAPRVGLGGKFEPVSRESMLLANNVLLVAAAGSVLLGTLYPLFLDALNLGKISVGPPYFEAVFVPLMTPAVFLMGLGPLARWKEASLPELAVRLKWALAVSLLTALLLPLVMGRWTPLVAFGLLLGAWIIATSAVALKYRLSRHDGNLWARLRAQPRSYYGMLLAHCGVAAFIIGVTLVKGYETERDVRMAVGDSVAVGSYTFRFDGVQEITGPNYRGSRGAIDVSRDGRHVRVLHPEKRVYNVQQNPMTEAAIDTGIFGDLYVSLGEPVSGGAWSVRVYHKPFVTWIWGGFIIMSLGGFLALSDRRYRVFVRRSEAIVPGSGKKGAGVSEAAAG